MVVCYLVVVEVEEVEGGIRLVVVLDGSGLLVSVRRIKMLNLFRGHALAFYHLILSKGY